VDAKRNGPSRASGATGVIDVRSRHAPRDVLLLHADAA
jgi:hypothetical protein